ncbi:MAG TPA: hypothetical protein PLM52_18960 [Tabrizicola sp.]|nr:hypothetical protein [Tabrizicola sp.]
MTPALARLLDALEAEAPDAVARGRVALGRALGWLDRTDWPEAAWAFSGLASGTPLELVWRPGRPGLFWTAEPAAPELPRPRRLRRGLAVLRANGTGLGPGREGLVRRVCRDAPGAWPVFVAGRHDGAGRDTGKAYVQAVRVPLGFADLGRHLLPQDRPMMTGIASTGQRELYWERRCQPGDLWRMRQVPALRDLAEALEAELQRWTGQGLDAAWKLGLSQSVGPDGTPLALAAFLHPRQAGGIDAVLRRLLDQGGAANPALADACRAGRLRPMLLTLAVSGGQAQQALGLRLPGLA